MSHYTGSENSSRSKLLVLSAEELERMNLEAKKRRLEGISQDEAREFMVNYLKKEQGIKAVTLAFSDIEGRFHMLDYDKRFLLESYDNLTFDGSSIRGFSNVETSDLRLEPDWAACYWLPAEIFSAGKVLIFANAKDQDGSYYSSDMRSRLREYLKELAKKGLSANIAVECEGFLLDGVDAEQTFNAKAGFKLVSTGGYFSALPKDRLRLFIDEFAEAKRAVGFENEKDHPEVAPSQFELNYRYTDALIAADQLQLYKLIARQIANSHGMTASFLPKPIAGINGSGMHTNLSIAKNGKNTFYDAKGEHKLSKDAWDFIHRLLYNANDLALIMSSSVNAFRRQDPAFEAPNQIKSSPNDRTSMVRIPLGNEKTARLEVRTVAPDANPYMVFYLLLRTGLEASFEKPDDSKRARTRILPSNIQDAMKHFKASEMMTRFLGEETKEKYLARKQIASRRCPRELGTFVKEGEVLFHHEVTNQYLWSQY